MSASSNTLMRWYLDTLILCTSTAVGSRCSTLLWGEKGGKGDVTKASEYHHIKKCHCKCTVAEKDNAR